MWIDTAMTTGGSILGSMAGISIATAMAAGAGGAAAGASAGSVAGPIGAAIGAIAGLALGGLFGGKPSNKEGRATYDLSTMEVEIGGQTGKKFSQENRDSAEALSELIATNIIPSLEQLGDTDISGQFMVGVGNRDPMRFSYREPGSERTGKNWDYGYGRDNSQGHSYYDAVSGNTRDPETYIDNVTKFFAGTIAGIPLGVYDALKKADEGYIDTIRRVELGAELFKNAGDQFSLITPDVSAWVPETGVENVSDEGIAKIIDNSSRGDILAVLKEMLPTDGLDDVTADFAENFLTATAQNLEAAIQDFGGVFGDDLSDELKSIVSTALADLNDSTGLYAQLMGEFITEEIYAAFKQGEENVFQTTSRVVTSFEVLVQVFDKLGIELEEVGMEGFALTEKMIELAGDFETLAGNLESYYQSFYSEEERAANTMSGLVESLEALGYAIPSTREAFRALVTELEAAGNLEGFNTLIENNQSYAAYYAQMEQWTASLFETYRNTIGRDPSAMELYRWLDKLKTGEALFSDVVKSLTTGLSEATEHLTQQDIEAFQSGAQDIYDAYQYTLEIAQEEHALALERISQEENLLKSLRGIIDNLKLSDISPMTPAERLAEAQRQYASILTAVEGGDFSRAGELDSAAQAYLGEASSYYASSGAYENIFNNVLGSLESLEAQYGTSLSYEERKEQLDSQLLATQDRAKSLLEDQLKALADSYQLDQSILSVLSLLPSELANAIAQVLPEAIGGEGTDFSDPSQFSLEGLSLDGIDSRIIDLYNNLLGRAPDAEGAYYWQQQYDAGMSLQEMTSHFLQEIDRHGLLNGPGSANGISVPQVDQAAYDQYKNFANGSHFGGIESVPFDGYKAILHRGEKVVPASRTKDDEKSALIAEIRALRAEVTQLREDQNRNAQRAEETTVVASNMSAQMISQSTKDAIESKSVADRAKVTMR
jgi:hypothetical protein